MTDRPTNFGQHREDNHVPLVDTARYDDLEPWERQWVDEMLVDGCPGKAATRAGLDGGAAANRLMKIPAVAAVLRQKMAEKSYRTQVTADMMLEHLWKMAQADKADIYNADGSIKPFPEWPEIFRMGAGIVEGYEVEELSERSHDGTTEDKPGGWDRAGRVTKIKFVSPLKLVELLMRHVNVKALQMPGDKIGEGLVDLAAAIDAKISEGRQRAAARNRLPATLESEEK